MDQKSNFNILNPSKYWIDSRCYRVPNSTNALNSVNYAEDDMSYQDDGMYQDEGDCELNSDVYVEYLSHGRYRSSIAVASSYFPFLIGSRGVTKHRIENETFTKISIPSRGQVGDVVVNGKDRKTVRQAIIHLELLVQHAKKKQPFTHFVAIPFNHASVQEKFIEFKKDVMEKCGSCRGIEESIFVEPEKLHLTICLMVLLDDRERKEAVQAFENVHKEIMEEHICGDPMKVDIQGIEYMNDDPAEVDVLYAKVSTSSWARSCQDLVDAIANKMAKQGIVEKQRDQVKLHMTLLNTKYRANDEGVRGNDPKNRVTFDAKQILKEFQDYNFGDAILSELHLSLRHSVSTDGFYSSSRSLSLIP